MPGSGMPNSLVPMGVAKTSKIPAGTAFIEQGYIESPPTMIAGIARDSSGAVLAGATLKLFRTADDSLVSQTISDANGNYVLPASTQFAHYVVAYLVGTPDTAGATVNTLVGV